MTARMNEYEFAQTAVNHTSVMISEVTRLPDGSSRDLSAEVLAGVLNAQSNLAIASALVLIASIMKESNQ